MNYSLSTAAEGFVPSHAPLKNNKHLNIPFNSIFLSTQPRRGKNKSESQGLTPSSWVRAWGKKRGCWGHASILSAIPNAAPNTTLCNPMDCSTPGFPVHHQLPELAQAYVHWVSDAIQPSHPVIPFSSCLQSFSASGSFLMSQFFASHGQIFEFQLQHQSFQWILGTDLLEDGPVGSPCYLRDSRVLSTYTIM